MDYELFKDKVIACFSLRGTVYQGTLIHFFPEKGSGMILVVKSENGEYIFHIKEKELECIAIVEKIEEKVLPVTVIKDKSSLFSI